METKIRTIALAAGKILHLTFAAATLCAARYDGRR